MSFSVKYEDALIESGQKQNTAGVQCAFAKKFIIGNDVKDVTFSAVKDPDNLCSANDLLNDRYGWRGYGSAHVIPSGVHHTTFTAEVDETVVGTITLAIDSECGLNIDHTFGAEVTQIRRMDGSQICELTRLAFYAGLRSTEIMASLFHLVFIYGTMISECTDLLIEINPRHAAFYEKMLNFERVGDLKTNHTVAAPSQLMNLKLDAIRRRIRELAGRSTPDTSRSLYSKFFPPLQEMQIRCVLLSKTNLSYVQHDNFYCGDADSESTMAAATPPGSVAPSNPAVPDAKKAFDATTRQDVSRAA